MSARKYVIEFHDALFGCDNVLLIRCEIDDPNDVIGKVVGKLTMRGMITGWLKDFPGACVEITQRPDGNFASPHDSVAVSFVDKNTAMLCRLTHE